MAKKDTIYFTFRTDNELSNEIKKRSNAGQSAHQTAARDLQRYYWLINDRNTQVDLTENEFKCVCDLLNGTSFSDKISFKYVADEVEDGLELYPEMAEKWDIDGDYLSGKLRALNIAQQYALIDRVELFFNTPEQDE